MNRDEIWKIGLECGGSEFNKDDPWMAFWPDKLEVFASRIESLVREECAQVCESFCDGNSMTANELADIIRKSEG